MTDGKAPSREIDGTTHRCPTCETPTVQQDGTMFPEHRCCPNDDCYRTYVVARTATGGGNP